MKGTAGQLRKHGAEAPSKSARPRAKRIALAKGILEDQYGISVQAGPAGPGRETRFRRRGEFDPKLGAEVTLERLEIGQQNRVIELREKGPAPARRGSLLEARRELLAQIPEDVRKSGTKYKQNLSADLRLHWLEGEAKHGAKWGHQYATDITEAMINKQIAIWIDAGVAHNTINHRVRHLRILLTSAVPDGTPLGTDKIGKLEEITPEGRGVPLDLVQFILDQIRDDLGGTPKRTAAGRVCAVCGINPIRNYRHLRCGACRFAKGAPRTFAAAPAPRVTRSTVNTGKIRLRLLAWAGIPHISIERLKPEDAIPNPEAAVRILLPLRKKGRAKRKTRTPRRRRPVDLIPDARLALRDFHRANLWGQHFDRGSMRRMWMAAVQRAIRVAIAEEKKTGDRALLEALEKLANTSHPPYILRHSYLTEVARDEADPRTINIAAGNAPDSPMWMHYTGAVVDEKLSAAIARIAARRPGNLRIVKGAAK